MNDMRATISQNIKTFRKAAGLTQSELAKKLGKATTSVATWEQGKSLPNPDTLYEICSVFGRDISEAYGEPPSLKWIPVSDALPKDKGLYYTTAKESTTGARIIVLYAGWDGQRWLGLDGGEMQIDVIAWMRLPKAYKE